MTFPKGDDAPDGGNKGGKKLRRYKDGDADAGSNGASVKPTNQAVRPRGVVK